jgi:uncharacterized protein involved in outer membrane biogenesis
MGILENIVEFILKFVLTVAVIGLLCFIAFCIFINFMDANRYKPMIQTAISAQTQQQLVLNGPIDIKFYPGPHVILKDTLTRYPMKDGVLEVKTGKLVFDVELMSVFAEKIKVHSFKASDVKLLYTPNKNPRNTQSYVIDNISAELSTTCCEMKIPSFQIQTKEGVLSGTLNLISANNILNVNGKLNVKKWSLPSLRANTADSKVFSHQPFAMDWLDSFQGKLDIHFDSLLLDQFSFQNADVTVTKNDKTTLQIHKGKLAGGDVVANIQVDKQKIQFLTDVKNANASEFLSLFHPAPLLKAGKLNMQLTGQSYGNDMATLMGNLGGKGLMSIYQMTILDTQFDSRKIDIFSAFWKSLNPKVKDTQLDCTAIRLTADQGLVKAKESIAFETKEIYVLGTGQLNLKTEQLNYTFDLYPRSQINIEIGSLDQVFYLKGTLANPKLVKSSKGFIREGGSVILGIATGGLTILAEKLVKIAQHKTSPCQEVLNQDN